MDADTARATTARGHLRIYLGAAPGVGKTYAMLDEGRHRLAQGTDVVVGFVEPHGRMPIAAMAEGLEAVPRRMLTYRDMSFTEMDLDAVLDRHPQVALVDELAHTNVPGSRNSKRWQDVEELLAAGVDVVTTLNVQHLESLNDTVRQITGTVQRERLPDEVARRADQIELVDLSAEALRRRMVHGDVYPADRIETALTHYFRPGNLTALRELALLWVADRVDEGLQRYRAEHGIAASWEARERILVGLTGDVGGETLIRRAARIAARIPGCDLVAVHVTVSSGLIGADPAVLARQHALVESLGGCYQQVIGDDVADALLSTAKAQNATQIVLGVSRRGRCARLLTGEDIAAKFIRLCGPINVHIVTHEGAARPPRLAWPRLASGLGPHRRWYAVVLAALLLSALTVCMAQLHRVAGTAAGPALYLVVVLVVALIGGLYPAVAAALAAGLLAGRFLPQFAAGSAGLTDVVVLSAFVITGALVGLAVETTAERVRLTTYESAQASILSTLAADALRGHDSPPALLEQLRQAFGLRGVSLLERRLDSDTVTRWCVTASAGSHPPERPEDADISVPVRERLRIAGVGRRLSASEERILTAYVTRIAAGLTRPAETKATTSALHGPPVAAIPDLCGSLAAAKAALADAADHVERLPASGRTRFAAAQAQIDGAVNLLADLDALCRLEAGALDCRLRPVDVAEVIVAAFDDLGADGRPIMLRLPEVLPYVIADSRLLTRAVAGLATDALRRSPSDSPPAIAATVEREHIRIRVIDHGSGTGASCPGADVAQRLARGLTETMGGTLRHERTPGGGRTVVITLPAAHGRQGGGPRPDRPASREADRAGG
ncbi:universal stress protein [Dactylosporangium fulvum]|uniref:Universal stress protein n=1 Tax=Dactylosporangium fulvum TaxID=53359 RepID=A0ABY5VSY4_9ACTN|nr:universal stress protein [Dactylosporangium fulvum]UWP79588.1 universal stress protein [Dactylosporangium fulvum]